MCPVYKFTRDEAAAPKAKANVLRALISGAIADSALFSQSFQDVMKRCVGCGSCAVECPSQVNIPKLATEARARYVRRFGASRHDRIVVEAELAAKWTRKMSGTLAPLLHTAGMRGLTEKLTGVSRHRDPVVFAARSLSERIPAQTGHGAPRVLYFAGCEAAYLEPDIGQAAVSVLSAMGMTVVAPPSHCCGLPQFSKGMIAAARKKIAANLRQWGAMIEPIDYVVVTCSSCGHALAETWADVEPGQRVKTIGAKLIHISRLVNRFADRLHLHPAGESVAYHAPCHLRIQPEPECSVSMMRRIPGLGVTPISGHCCGMAGSWGLAAANYELSRRIGAAMIQGFNGSACDVGATDCPTCRMQMRAFSKKPVYHPIQIIADAIPSAYARPPLHRSLALSTSK
jgi:Fe-S oxidoreductase